MHLYNSHLGEITQITHLLRAEKRRVDAAGGCEDDAVVGSTTRGLILHSGRDAAVECDVARRRYVTTQIRKRQHDIADDGHLEFFFT